MQDIPRDVDDEWAKASWLLPDRSRLDLYQHSTELEPLPDMAAPIEELAGPAPQEVEPVVEVTEDNKYSTVFRGASSDALLAKIARGISAKFQLPTVTIEEIIDDDETPPPQRRCWIY